MLRYGTTSRRYNESFLLLHNTADRSQIHSDYDKLAEVLLQRPLDLGVNKLSTRLTEQDIAYMQQMAKERFDTVLNTLKQMPRQMLFVIRCDSLFVMVDPFILK